MEKEQQIVFISCSGPIGQPKIRIERESETIKKILENNKRTCSIAFKIEVAHEVMLNEFRRKLNCLKPKIVHFSGHTTEDGNLIFCNSDGKQDVVPGSGIVQFLEGYYAHGLKCVIFNSCFSNDIALQLSYKIPYVIGYENKAIDTIAMEFSESFYEYLFNNNTFDIVSAFDNAIAYLKACGYENSTFPKLFRKNDVNTEELQNIAFIYPVFAKEDTGVFYGDSLNNVYWRANDVSTIKLYSHKESVTAIAVSNSHKLVSAGRDNKLIVYDFFDNKIIGNITHGYWVYGLSFLDENTFVSGGNDGYIKVWKIIGQKIHMIYENKVHNDRINDLLVMNNNFIISCGKDRNLSVFDFSNEIGFKFEVPEIPYCLCYENGSIGIGTDTGKVFVFEIEKRAISISFRAHNKRINGISFYKNTIITGSRDCSICCYDTKLKQHLNTTQLKGEVNRLAIYRNNLYAGTDNDYLYHWEVLL